jgi:hypothetical protein
MKNILICLLLLSLGGCSSKNIVKPEQDSIDLFDAFEKKKIIYLSQIIENAEYIPLEMTANSVVSHPEYSVVTDDYIIVRNILPQQILLFDRTKGKFIKGVGRQGRGPDEYGQIPVDNFYNSEKNIIYAYDTPRKQILFFNLDGRKFSSIKFPLWVEPQVKGGYLSVNYGSYLDSVTFACRVPNYSGIEKKKLIIYSADSILRIFPNYLRWGDGKGEITSGKAIFSTNFMRWDNNLYFKEIFNDTLFKVTKTALIPRLVFNGGKYSFPYELQGDILPPLNAQRDYFLITDIDENSRYLFFQLLYKSKTYTGFYNKLSKTTSICDSSDGKRSELIDDINNFLPITPFGFTKNNEMVAALKAEDIKKWIDANPEKLKSLGKKFPWLNKIDELSNPVIFIAKCKD